MDAFVRRKNRLISQCVKPNQRWSHLWSKRVTEWHAHVMRNTQGSCLSARVVGIRSTEELERRRIDNNGRLAVRAFSGFSAMRCFDSVADAEKYATSC